MKTAGVQGYDNLIAKARELGALARKSQDLALKKEELGILENIYHTYGSHAPSDWIFMLAESWNTFSRMLKWQNRPDHYALAMTFVKYRDSFFNRSGVSPKSWEFVSFLIAKKLEDNNWPSLGTLIEQASSDFQKPTLDYIVADLNTFSTDEVLRMRPTLRKLTSCEGFYI